MNVFWAWQSDCDSSVCRNLIKSALEKALAEIAADLALSEAERPEVDHDTKGVAGMPDIVQTLFDKIQNASAFVADLTTIARSKAKKGLANPNVLIELGFAKRALGTDRIVTVANGHWYKGPADLPFDLRHRRGPIVYELSPEAGADERKLKKTQLVAALKAALTPIVEHHRARLIATAKAEDFSEALDQGWFSGELTQAQQGLAKLDLSAHMELRLHPSTPLKKTPAELLAAARQSQITTFGWPIGIIGERDEYRPRPFRDGVRAELSIERDSLNGKKSYDYWAFNSNGDYFLLQSLFEDMRNPGAIFFDTRIVRVAESLLYAGKLYAALGLKNGTAIAARVTHRNFSGRTLTAAGNRNLFPSTATENIASETVTIFLGSESENLVDNVKAILAPYFALFDYKEIADSVYEELVRNFERGIIR